MIIYLVYLLGYNADVSEEDIYVCYLQNADFLFGLLFGPEDGSDCSSEMSADFHGTT
jgi:hypothetical protein